MREVNPTLKQKKWWSLQFNVTMTWHLFICFTSFFYFIFLNNTDLKSFRLGRKIFRKIQNIIFGIRGGMRIDFLRRKKKKRFKSSREAAAVVGVASIPMKNESHLQTFLIHFYWQRVENVFGRIDDSINGKKALFVLFVTWKGFFFLF